MLSKVYLFLGGGLLLLYAVAAWSGWELGTGRRDYLPPQYRGSDYRNVPRGFWYTGYRGGK